MAFACGTLLALVAELKKQESTAKVRLPVLLHLC